ncbi:hypothetical protein L6452_29069 [Arctium lappa]|uniref:Uncharacterized protein n=1 Tax=Arctium lappa TaxID=4217 RepID=A0ACB8ZH69_ARCLA|nr:hypothetical protein L6452_29069 [Arctium lappa]
MEATVVVENDTETVDVIIVSTIGGKNGQLKEETCCSNCHKKLCYTEIKMERKAAILGHRIEQEVDMEDILGACRQTFSWASFKQLNGTTYYQECTK